MKYIIIMICSFILPIFSLKVIKPKLCINCKHFITDNDNGKYGKCALFPKNEGKINYLINGIMEEQYFYCCLAREVDEMCGEQGKRYERKIIKKAVNKGKQEQTQ